MSKKNKKIKHFIIWSIVLGISVLTFWPVLKFSTAIAKRENYSIDEALNYLNNSKIKFNYQKINSKSAFLNLNNQNLWENLENINTYKNYNYTIDENSFNLNSADLFVSFKVIINKLSEKRISNEFKVYLDPKIYLEEELNDELNKINISNITLNQNKVYSYNLFTQLTSDSILDNINGLIKTPKFNYFVLEKDFSINLTTKSINFKISISKENYDNYVSTNSIFLRWNQAGLTETKGVNVTEKKLGVYVPLNLASDIITKEFIIEHKDKIISGTNKINSVDDILGISVVPIPENNSIDVSVNFKAFTCFDYDGSIIESEKIISFLITEVDPNKNPILEFLNNEFNELIDIQTPSGLVLNMGSTSELFDLQRHVELIQKDYLLKKFKLDFAIERNFNGERGFFFSIKIKQDLFDKNMALDKLFKNVINEKNSWDYLFNKITKELSHYPSLQTGNINDLKLVLKIDPININQNLWGTANYQLIPHSWQLVFSNQSNPKILTSASEKFIQLSTKGVNIKNTNSGEPGALIQP